MSVKEDVKFVQRMRLPVCGKINSGAGSARHLVVHGAESGVHVCVKIVHDFLSLLPSLRSRLIILRIK